jgi:hypothetical protein
MCQIDGQASKVQTWNSYRFNGGARAESHNRRQPTALRESDLRQCDAVVEAHHSKTVRPFIILADGLD